MQAPLEFLRRQFPAIFSRGVAVLRQRAESGDQRSARQLEDVCGVKGSAALYLDDKPPVFLCVSGGEISFSEQPVADSEIKLVAQVPEQALSVLLGRALQQGALEQEDVAVGAARLVSKRLEDMLANRPMTCHLIVHGVPNLGQVNAVIGFNVSEVPVTPGFSAGVAFSDLQLAQEGETSMQELFMGGKLKMEGDYSTALQLAVQLMTNPI